MKHRCTLFIARISLQPKYHIHLLLIRYSPIPIILAKISFRSDRCVPLFQEEMGYFHRLWFFTKLTSCIHTHSSNSLFSKNVWTKYSHTTCMKIYQYLNIKLYCYTWTSICWSYIQSGVRVNDSTTSKY